MIDEGLEDKGETMSNLLFLRFCENSAKLGAPLLSVVDNSRERVGGRSAESAGGLFGVRGEIWGEY